MAIPDKSLEIYRSLDKLNDDIKGYKKKYEEDVEVSLAILSNLKLRFNDDLLKSILHNLELKMVIILNNAEEHIELLRFFVLSEIIHRKLQNIKFRLANPFFFTRSKEEFRSIIYELEDLDDAALKRRSQDIAPRYEDLIKRVRALEDGLDEERKTGLIDYLKWIIPGASGWTAAVLMYLSVYASEQLRTAFWIFALLASFLLFFFVPLVLLFWNRLSYGFIYTRRDRSTIVFYLLLVPLLIASTYAFIMKIRGGYYDIVYVYGLVMMICLGFVYLLTFTRSQKKVLLKKDIKNLVDQFGLGEFFMPASS